jgi:uncharacterized membrane protein YfcA
MGTMAAIIALAFLQNTSFSVVSRARNRNNMAYHAIASVASNGIWFATFHLLVIENMSWYLWIPYCTGTVLGSLFGAKLSMRIEGWLGATT